ncbi:MAG: TDT family transporter [Gordonibacter urolithinfaciens]
MYVKDKVSKLPLPVVPAALGLLVLSGVYDTLGFPIVHWLAVAAATAVVVLYALKIAFHLRSVVAAEYANPMLAALYPTVPMLVMVLCVFYAQLFPAAWAAAQAVFFAMLGLLCVHVAVFFARFFLRRFEWKTFMPSWYVTTNGVMVSTVAGMPFIPEPLAVGIVVWGIAIYVAVTPFMLWRMKRCEVAEAMMHSQAIMLGPCSMCLVSYVNVFPDPNLVVMGLLFACEAVSLVYVVAKLPKFFGVAFHPGYAGMTFPMAVGLLATRGLAGALEGAGLSGAAWAVEQLAGVQLVLATTLVAVVSARFLACWRPARPTARRGAGTRAAGGWALRAAQARVGDVAPSGRLRTRGGGHRVRGRLRWRGRRASRRAGRGRGGSCGRRRLTEGRKSRQLYLIVTFKPSNSQNGHSSVICFSRPTFILGGSKRKAPLLFSLHLLYPLKAESVPNRHRIIPSLWPGELPSRRADPFPSFPGPIRHGSQLRPPPLAR